MSWLMGIALIVLRRVMMSKDLYEALNEVLDSWGLCSICDAEHAWANVKCDLQFFPAEEGDVDA